MARAQMLSPTVSLQELPKVGRKQRRPSHSFALRTRPWQIQPFMIAPVLPGETMKNLLLQSRVVSGRLNDGLVGWWTEFYFFYVKLRDLPQRDALTDMLVTNANVDAYKAPDFKEIFYEGPGDMQYVRWALQRVVEEYFRDEDEAWDVATLDELPLAQIGNSSWTDSLIPDSKVADADDTPEAFPGNQMPAPYDGFDQHYAHWEAMRSMQLTAVDFEDWLKTFGVKVPSAAKEEKHRPELLRYVREWTYPTANGVFHTSTGPVAGPMCSWSIAERADKDRFFSEPGFVFGVNVTRPKVYLGAQYQAAVGLLNDAYAWLPAILQPEPYTSLKKVGLGTGPASDMTEAYWVDLRDLFMYGDQFLNFDPWATVSDKPVDALSMVNLPADNGARFASSQDVDALFRGTDDAGGTPAQDVASLLRIKVEGRCDLNILSRLEDTSL